METCYTSNSNCYGNMFKCSMYSNKYRINKENINSIDIKENICKIKGNGSVQMPEWAEEDSTVKKTSKEFSFIMAFEQGDVAKIIAEWRI